MWIPVNITPIVTRETWEKAQQQIKENKRLAKRNTQHDYLLKGILVCGHCGRKMVAYSRKSPRKKTPAKTHYYYSCVRNESNSYILNNSRCPSRRIPSDDLDSLIWTLLVEAVKDQKELVDYIIHDENLEIEIQYLSTYHKELSKKLTNISNWYRNNLLDSQTTEAGLIALNKEEKMVSDKINKLTEQQKISNQSVISPSDYLSTFTAEDKRQLLLRFPYQILAIRLQDEIHFWFQEV